MNERPDLKTNEARPKPEKSDLKNVVDVWASKCDEIGDFLEMIAEAGYEEYISTAFTGYLKYGEKIEIDDPKWFVTTLANGMDVKVRVL
jgi:hypothetical protein